MAFAALAFTTFPAEGQDRDELARRHFESGAAYFAEAEYEEALRAFRKAYELSNRPQILLNVAVVEERLGNLPGAVEALDDYLAKNPQDPEVDTIRLRRNRLAQRIAPTAADPPPPEEPQQRVPPPPPQQPTPPPEREPNRVPAYIAFSVGGLTGLGAALTGLGAKAEYDELESDCGGSCTDDQTSTGETLALTSTILTGVAVLGVGAGVVLWFLAERDESTETVGSSPRVSVSAGPGGGYAQARWRF